MSPDSTSHSADRELVELRAYEIYLERNDGPGSPLEDWLQAEQELFGRQDEGQVQDSSESIAMHNATPAPTTDKLSKNQRAKATKAGS